MPSVSKAQQRFMGLVHAYKKGDIPPSQVSQAVKDAAKSMKKKSTKKFASTKHDDLPNKVRSENMNEDGHTDVASAERKLKLIMKDAMDTLNALRNLSNEDSLPSWWTDKITLAKDYVGKSRDYIMNPAESVNEDITSAGYFFLRKAAYGIGVALKDLNKGIKRQKDKMVFNEIDYIYDKVMDMKRMMKNKNYNESVNENIKDAMKNAIHQVKTFDKPSNAKLMTIKVINKLKEKRNSSKSTSNKKQLQKMINKVESDYKKGKYLKEATSLGADMLLGGIATVIKKAGMRPKTAKMMGGGFKVSKRDKVGFKIDVEIRGMDKKKTFPLQFETERGMLYVVIKNKPIKLGKYTMVSQAAQNLKKVGTALIGDKDVKRIA